MYSFPSLEPVHCSMSCSNYCFLTCIQVSQEGGKMVWYFHLFKNFPHFVVIHISSVQSLSCLLLFVIPWTAECQASLSITNSQSLLKLMSIKFVMPSNNLILCHPFLFLLSIFPSIRVFFMESVLRIRWQKHWSFNLSIGPSEVLGSCTVEAWLGEF